ncbi:MAG: CrcB family protein [Bifidobacteriaceae bacterium]|nr:CrcB family protein [Bifidobacteriaceae bacterium]
MTWLAVALGGALGSVARYGVGQAIRRRVSSSAAWTATFVVNLAGSLALGWLVGVAAAGASWGAWHVIVGVGLLGGFTTFSTASLAAATLLAGPAAQPDSPPQGGRRRSARPGLTALAYALAMAALSISAAALGLALA